MRKMKLFLTAAAVICALSGCAGKTEAPKDQTQAASEAKTEKAEEAGKEAGKSENAGETEEAKKTETPENGEGAVFAFVYEILNCAFRHFTERHINECDVFIPHHRSVDFVEAEDREVFSRPDSEIAAGEEKTVQRIAHGEENPVRAFL